MSRSSATISPDSSSTPFSVAAWQLPLELAPGCRRLGAAIGKARGRNASFIVAITSAAHGAGVTTIARSVARYLAQAGGDTVLLLDASARAVRGPGTRGAWPTWAAAAQAGASSSIASTTDDRLSLLTLAAGEPVAADHVRRIYDEIRRRFGYVVVDCPPVLEDPTPAAILQPGDGGLLVVDGGAMALDQAREAAAILRATTRLLGLVVNRQPEW